MPIVNCWKKKKKVGHFFFAPSVEEIYPEPDTRQFSYAPLDTVMEGRFVQDILMEYAR